MWSYTRIIFIYDYVCFFNLSSHCNWDKLFYASGGIIIVKD